MKFLSIISMIVILSSCLQPADNSRSFPKNDQREPVKPAQPQLPQTDDLAPIFEFLKIPLYREIGTESFTYKKYTEQFNTLDFITSLIPTETLAVEQKREKLLFPTINCGVQEDLDTILDMINDCQKKNPNSSTWNGELKGISAEGIWLLVYKNGQDYIWRDQKTGTMWTSPSSKEFTWTHATGHQAREDEIACTNLNLPKNFKWRLPNKYEFFQASIHGIEHFYTEIEDNKLVWTLSSIDETRAWAIDPKNSSLKIFNSADTLSVICVAN